MMNARHIHFYNHMLSGGDSLPRTQQNPIFFQPPLQTYLNSFPILAIVVLGVVVTAILLLFYFILVMKCCLPNWQRSVDLLSQFSISQTRRSEVSLVGYSLPVQMHNRGLNDMPIHVIPAFQFRGRGGGRGEDSRGFFRCMVCLNEFQEHETLRVIPSCTHAFHLDCIDIWLQGNSSCPLCRTSISGTATNPTNIQGVASSPQESQHYANSLMGSDEDFVIIELGGGGEFIRPPRRPEIVDSRKGMVQCGSNSRPVSESSKFGNMKHRNAQQVSSRGDECIDIRGKDDQFSIQPIRRSFSLGSAADRHLYESVQEIVQHNNYVRLQSFEECGSRVQKSCFSFRQGRGSNNAVCPV